MAHVHFSKKIKGAPAALPTIIWVTMSITVMNIMVMNITNTSTTDMSITRVV